MKATQLTKNLQEGGHTLSGHVGSVPLLREELGSFNQTTLNLNPSCEMRTSVTWSKLLHTYVPFSCL